MTPTPHPLPKTQPRRLAFQWFANLKIGPKLTLGFSILVLLVFFNAWISYQGGQRATTNIGLTSEVRVPLALAATQAQAHLLQMQADVRGYLALGNPIYRENYYRSDADFQTALRALDALLKTTPEASNRRRLVELEVAYQEWTLLPEQLFELRDDQLDREPAYRLLAVEGIRSAGQVLIAISSMIDEQAQREPSRENTLLLKDMAKFQGNFTAVLSALRGYVTTRNRIYRGEYEVNLEDNMNAWNALIEKRNSMTSNQRDLLKTIATHREAFLTLHPQIFSALEGEAWRADLYLFQQKAVPQAETMQRLLAEMVEDQQKQLGSELAAGVSDLRTTTQVILTSGILALLISFIAAYLTRANIAGPVMRLTGVAGRIRGGDLEAQAVVESSDEIGDLAAAFNNMTAQLRATLSQVRKEKRRADDLLEVVIPIGIELSTERDFNRLLEKMLLEAKSFCNADAGTLYLVADDALRFTIVRNDTLGLALGGTTGKAIPYPPLNLQTQEHAPADHLHIAAQVARSGVASNLPQHDCASAILPNYHVTSLLTLPLKNSQGIVLGVLQLLNAQDPETHQTVGFDDNLQQMMESFSSLAVAALEAYIREQQLHREIEELRIEIDHAKKAKQVNEITESDYFQTLRQRARDLRERPKSDS